MVRYYNMVFDHILGSIIWGATPHAIENGNIHILEFIYELDPDNVIHYVQWHDNKDYHAIAHNHFEVIKWLFTHGVEMKDDTLVTAIAMNNLEMIKYLDEIGCECNGETYIYGLLYGNDAIKQYFIKNESLLC